MNVLGNKIREARESKKISPQDLVKDICRENVIQMIELKNRCDSRDVFTAICKRLDLKVEECIEYKDEEKLSLLLDEIEIKCNRLEHKDAYRMLCNYDVGDALQNILVVSSYYYYLGITTLLGGHNSSLALLYLNKVLEYGDNVSIYSILSINALGLLYEKESDMEKAEEYNKKSLILLDSYIGELVPMVYKIYYNVARFYSEIKKYHTAIQICEQAIALNEENRTFYYLEFLYYELGFNKNMIGESAVLDYKMA